MFNNVTDLVNYVCSQYPDYQYNGCERMATGDGTIIEKITLTHKHKPGNLVQITYSYDKKTNTWQELSTN